MAPHGGYRPAPSAITAPTPRPYGRCETVRAGSALGAMGARAALALFATGALFAAGALRTAGAAGRCGGLLAAAGAAGAGTGGAVAGSLLGGVHGRFLRVASTTGCRRWRHSRRRRGARPVRCDERSAGVQDRSGRSTERARRGHERVAPAPGPCSDRPASRKARTVRCPVCWLNGWFAVAHLHLAVEHGEDLLAVVDVPAVRLVGPVQPRRDAVHLRDVQRTPGAIGTEGLAANDLHGQGFSLSLEESCRQPLPSTGRGFSRASRPCG